MMSKERIIGLSVQRMIFLSFINSSHFVSHSFPASQTTKHLGRKPSMFISAVLYLIGAALVTAARKRILKPCWN